MSRSKYFFSMMRISSFILFFCGMFLFAEKSYALPDADIQQQISVTGTVTDTGGDPLPGVSVMVTGTTQGTATDTNGAFSLSVPNENAVLVFSYIGFLSQEITVGSQRRISVTLLEDTRQLDEVVVVGYGSVRKKDLTGSVVALSGDDLPKVSGSHVLQGKVAGLYVSPKGSGSEILIRGKNSISQANDALIIVDGLPGSIPNVEYIESIAVLKDAASTAIYGARGANGVIVVTTKAPKDRLYVNYEGRYNVTTPREFLPTMNAYDYIAYNWAYADAYGNAYRDAWEQLWAIGPGKSFSYRDLEGNMQQISNPSGIDYYRNVDARDKTRDIYTTASSHSHRLQLSGGSDKTKLLMKLAYSQSDKGALLNTRSNGGSFQLRVDQKITETFDLRMDVSYSDSYSASPSEETLPGAGSGPLGGGSVWSTAYLFRPIATTHVQGLMDARINSSLGMYNEVLQDRYNPVDRIMDMMTENYSRGASGQVRLKWEIIPGLTAHSDLSLGSSWSKYRNWRGAVYLNYLDTAGEKLFSGDAALNQGAYRSVYWSNNLAYKLPDLHKDHSMDAVVGYEITNSEGSSMSINGRKYPTSFDMERAFAMMNQYNTTEAGTNYGLSSNTGLPDRLVSYFGRVNYSFMDRYLLTLTMRADGSSRFAPNKRWGYFPAAALAWRISEESFLRDVQWLDILKYRLSYGTAGNDGISANQWKMLWASGGLTNSGLDNSRQPYYMPSGGVLANPYLSWETTVTRNTGIDYGLFNNRIYGSVDAYWNTTKDLLLRAQISAISGYTTTYDNVGQTSNKGLEFSLGADIIRAKDYSLTFNGTISFNRNNIDQLNEGVNGLYTSNWASAATRPSRDYVIKEGYSIGTVRGYVYDGFYTTDDFDYANGVYTLKPGVQDVGGTLGQLGSGTGFTNNPGTQGAYPGAPKFKDISGPNGVPDGMIDEYDVDIIGTMTPKHTGGFYLQGRFKWLDAGLYFNWCYGNQIYNANKIAALTGDKQYGLYRNRLELLNDCYKYYDIQGGELVRVVEPAALNALNANAKMYNPYMENCVISSYFMEDGSFLKLNTINIGATLPAEWTRKIAMQTARIFFSMTNVFTWTKYSGLEPEVNMQPNMNGAYYPTVGMDYGTYPRSSTFVMGVNLEF